MKRVLVVDDDPLIREVAQLGLERVGGWVVRTARNGAEGVEIAASEQPDVIPMDVMMSPGQHSMRRTSIDDSPIPNARAIRNPDSAPSRNDVIPGQEGPDDPEQDVWIDQRVGIDSAYQLSRRTIEPCVECVCLAAVVLVDHHQATVTS